jgi:hypothetical protein
VFLQKMLCVILTDIKINKFGINVFALSWISSSESFSAFSLKKTFYFIIQFVNKLCNPFLAVGSFLKTKTNLCSAKNK